jgi:plastocyanin
MGRSRFLHPCLIAVLLLVAACGGGDEDLLVAGNLDEVYSGGGGAGAYGPEGSGTGTIVGRVTFQGRAWKQYRLDITTTDGFCVNAHGAGGMMSEDFLVGADGALQNVVVYVKKGLETQSFDPPSEPVVLDQRGCQYIPHVAVLQHGQTLIVKSSDNTNHNVHMARGPNGELNRSMTRPGQLEPMTFRKTEVARRVYCDVHGWMVCWLAILPHPFHAITAKDGTYKIENVPAGTYQLGAWHEKKKLGEQTQDVTVKPGETVTVDIVFERK